MTNFGKKPILKYWWHKCFTCLNKWFHEKKMKEISQSALTTFSQKFREINELRMKLLIAFSRNFTDLTAFTKKSNCMVFSVNFTLITFPRFFLKLTMRWIVYSLFSFTKHSLHCGRKSAKIWLMVEHGQQKLSFFKPVLPFFEWIHSLVQRKRK